MTEMKIEVPAKEIDYKWFNLALEQARENDMHFALLKTIGETNVNFMQASRILRADFNAKNKRIKICETIFTPEVVLPLSDVCVTAIQTYLNKRKDSNRYLFAQNGHFLHHTEIFKISVHYHKLALCNMPLETEDTKTIKNTVVAKRNAA